MTQQPLLPLCVDLDGTLIRTDITQESLLLALWKKPWILFLLPWWLIQGRASLKRRLAEIVIPAPSRLPLNYDVVVFLEQEKERGVSLYLVTAADAAPSKAIAQHLGIFQDVFASDGSTNLRGEAKGNFLVNYFGEKGFIYAGNSRDDLLVWRYAAQAVAVNTPFNVMAILKRMSLPIHIIKDGNFSWFKTLSIIPPLSLISAVLVGFIGGWPWASLILCSTAGLRLFRTLILLRHERVQPLTNLRIHLLLGHISIPRAWIIGGLLTLGGLISLQKILYS